MAGVFADGKLKKVSVSGGATLTLGDAAQSHGASWGSQGMITFSPVAVSALRSRWLAYISDESGHYETYVQPYPGPGGKWQVSTEGGTEPAWNPNGRELFYRNGDKMMAADVVTKPSFSVGKPRVLFKGPYLPTPGTVPAYDVSPDGQRFLMLSRASKRRRPRRKTTSC
jgi:hypothetical protein